jgi:hypothetical protein
MTIRDGLTDDSYRTTALPLNVPKYQQQNHQQQTDLIQ